MALCLVADEERWLPSGRKHLLQELVLERGAYFSLGLSPKVPLQRHELPVDDGLLGALGTSG